MRFGRVVGRVWSTVKNEEFTGERLLVVQPLTPELENTGKPLVCTDAVGAGSGELVFWVRGREASYALLPKEVPSDNTIVAIIDHLHVKRPKLKPGNAAPPPAPEIQDTAAPALSRVRRAQPGGKR